MPFHIATNSFKLMSVYLCLNWSTETLIYLCHNLHGICGVGTDIWIKCNDISPYGGFTLVVQRSFLKFATTKI